ncbi:hypothetical protein PIB30_067864 [Stylosanthes scabra]|uniref:Putative plant transposon protein domain-containing protein n=1 Tax=Stylosanthes scabra TaxID=79078 RepID=A0ABU6WL30_9FABA|nr:hypothetical protein [Stylosanthes scabra]
MSPLDAPTPRRLQQLSAESAEKPYTQSPNTTTLLQNYISANSNHTHTVLQTHLFCSTKLPSIPPPQPSPNTQHYQTLQRPISSAEPIPSTPSNSFCITPIHIHTYSAEAKFCRIHPTTSTSHFCGTSSPTTLRRQNTPTTHTTPFLQNQPIPPPHIPQPPYHYTLTADSTPTNSAPSPLLPSFFFSATSSTLPFTHCSVNFSTLTHFCRTSPYSPQHHSPSCLGTSKPQVWCGKFQYIHKKGVTLEKHFELQEGQYPKLLEHIGMRGWRRLSKPITKISKALIQEFYANAVRIEAEIAWGEDYPYMSYVRGVPVDFSAAKIREVLKIHFLTPGAETDFKTRQMEDQRLDEVIRDICVPGTRWKMSSSQPDQPIQLKRQDLTPLAKGWAEFIIHLIIPTGNKSEITVARVVLIHLIIKGHDVRVEELIADNIAIIAEVAQGRSKLSFSSTIFRLCKEAGVSMAEFRGTEYILVARPITAKVMTITRGRIINNNPPQDQNMEEEEEQ